MTASLRTYLDGLDRAITRALAVLRQARLACRRSTDADVARMDAELRLNRLLDRRVAATRE